jgi:hypothetical protein
VRFRIGDEYGWIAGVRQERSGYPALPRYRDWTVSTECGDFRGEYLAVLTDDDVVAFAEGLIAACDATGDGDHVVPLGADRGQAATITVYRRRGELSHAVAELTPHGTDPIPCLTLWLNLDPPTTRAEAARLLHSVRQDSTAGGGGGSAAGGGSR